MTHHFSEEDLMAVARKFFTVFSPEERQLVYAAAKQGRVTFGTHIRERDEEPVLCCPVTTVHGYTYSFLAWRESGPVREFQESFDDLCSHWVWEQQDYGHECTDTDAARYILSLIEEEEADVAS